MSTHLIANDLNTADTDAWQVILCALTVLLILGGWIHPAPAAPPRALPLGRLPADTRLGPLRGERGDFSFVPPASAEGWAQRKAELRRILHVTLGLWPMPTKTALNPVIHGRIDQGEYTVEKVYFESIPGFYVTGNLYRPSAISGRAPGVLSPHGHFPGGRFNDSGADEVHQQIARGAERFTVGGRSFMQSRCVQLARMGCVVFHYDMVGYGDSAQIPLDVAHRFSRSRVKFKTPPTSGFYSAQAELHLQNPMGLHTYNSIRALDFLLGLPDVDPNRIAVTGGSGGGTQTFMLCAVDERPLVSVPAVIVSTKRQGGCTCENISGLRIGSYNLEFTAMHAPKPLLLISADDDTRTMPEKGFPELLRHYDTLDARQHVSHAPYLQFPHNFNYVSRQAMYHWLNRHLDLGLSEPIEERDYHRLGQEHLSVWNEEYPRPAGAEGGEQSTIQWLIEDGLRQLAALTPDNKEGLQRFRRIVGGAWHVLLRGRPEAQQMSFGLTRSRERETFRESTGRLSYQTVDDHQAQLPLILLTPRESNGRTVVWVTGEGKSGLYTSQDLLRTPIQRLLEAGVTVIAADLLYQGEFRPDIPPMGRQRILPSEEAFAGWTYCYNLPLFVHRVQDILAVAQWAQAGDVQARDVTLVGIEGAGPWVAAAMSQAEGAASRVAIDTRGFRFEHVKDVYDVDFLPGAAKYGDLPSLLALAAPTRLWVAGEGHEAPVITGAAYESAGVPENLTVFPGPDKDASNRAVDWLLD